ncbi:hypothetical protein ACFVAJ_17190 [Agromyces sp. NPDC057679]|uniref:hypothetical protein n=1 Tax=Agromyces sp. NPDC057679 TaxID=3346207 RepID=UPI0036703C21
MPLPRYTSDSMTTFEGHEFQNGAVVPTITDRETEQVIAHVATPEAADLIARSLNLQESAYRLRDLDGTDDAARWLTAGHVLSELDVEFIRGLLIVPLQPVCDDGEVQ